VRLAADQDATAEQIRVGVSLRLRVRPAPENFLRSGVDQINVAAAPTRRRDQAVIGRRCRAMNRDRAMVKRLLDHGDMRRSNAARHEAEGRAGVFVEARQVDRCLDGVGARIDHRKGVRILVADEDAVFGLNPALARLS